MGSHKQKVYKLYKVDNHKESEVKGYWQNSKGKLYIDNIHIKALSGYELNNLRYRIFKYGQKTIFYTCKNHAYIEHIDKRPLEILTNRILINQKSITERYIKDLLIKYNGLTLFKNLEGYTIEIWQK